MLRHTEDTKEALFTPKSNPVKYQLQERRELQATMMSTDASSVLEQMIYVCFLHKACL